MSETKVDQITTCVNPHDNGGESLIFTTEFHDNGDDGANIFLTQTITLHSYSNSSSFHLSGAILTPEILRKMADDIEARMKKLSKG